MLSDKYPQANGARARFFQCLDLPQVDERRELVAFVDDGFGISGSGFKGLREDIGGELFQVGGDCRCCLRHVL